MTCVTFFAQIARISYFIAAISMIMGSFVHLNIYFQVDSCRNVVLNISHSCIGRNLIWLHANPLSIDSNVVTWRTVFTLEPEKVVSIWCPMFMSILAFIQHFEGSKWDLISGSWFRAFLFTLFWNLFGVFGYAANWGVVMGFYGVCWVNLTYFILIFITPRGDVPVLQLDLGPITGHVKTIKERRFSRKSQTDNPQQNDNNNGFNNDTNTNFSNNYDFNNNNNNNNNNNINISTNNETITSTNIN